MTSTARTLAAALTVVTLATHALAATSTDLWHTFLIDGAKAGWGRYQTTTRDNGDIVTRETSVMRLGRADTQVTIEESETFTETADNTPIRIERAVSQGPTARNERYVFDHDNNTVAVTIRTTDHTTAPPTATTSNSTVPIPAGTWLTPAAERDFHIRRYRAGAPHINTTTLTADNGALQLIRTHSTIHDRTTFTLPDGDTIDATHVSIQSDELPGVTITAIIDNDANPLSSELKLGAITIQTTITTPEQAQADWEAPELMSSTAVVPTGQPIEHPRLLERATYTLSVNNGTLPDIPDTTAQSTTRTSDATATVSIDRRPAPNPTPISDEERAEALAPSTTIDAHNPAIRELARRFIKDAGLPPDAPQDQRARHLRFATYNYIDNKDLATAFATASETATTRAGDCTEHAVLLAALLRADGIPARVVTGLIYADGLAAPNPNNAIAFNSTNAAFGYHMWTQALVPHPTVENAEYWLDLDASWPARFDATHIALATSTLTDHEPQGDLVPLLTLMGNLNINVEDTKIIEP